MSNIEVIEILRQTPEARLPVRAHADDAGLDLFALEDVNLPAGAGRKVRTGIALAIPPKHVGMICDRSSMAAKGVKTAGGIIDSGYRGEVQVIVWNISGQAIQIRHGEKVAQMLVIPIATPAVQEVTQLSETTRGEGGFGSTGR